LSLWKLEVANKGYQYENFYKEGKPLGKREFFFFSVLGLELRAYTLSHSTSPFFVRGFFEIGFCELFAWASFES
jgi:hypothetical protein